MDIFNSALIAFTIVAGYAALSFVVSMVGALLLQKAKERRASDGMD